MHRFRLMSRCILFPMILGPQLLLVAVGEKGWYELPCGHILAFYFFGWAMPYGACMAAKINPGIFVIWAAPLMCTWFHNPLPAWYPMVYMGSMAVAGAVFLIKGCRISVDTRHL